MFLDMKAYTRTDAQTMQIVHADVAAPEPGQGEIVISMKAFGIGIYDRYFIPPDGPFPYTIGIEGAGVMHQLGAGIDGLTVGDRVMISSSRNPKGGTWAELAVTNRAGITATRTSTKP